VCVGLYNNCVYCTDFVHERIIPFLPLPICIAYTIAILLHGYCAIYDPPPTILLLFSVSRAVDFRA